MFAQASIRVWSRSQCLAACSICHEHPCVHAIPGIFAHIGNVYQQTVCAFSTDGADIKTCAAMANALAETMRTS